MKFDEHNSTDTLFCDIMLFFWFVDPHISQFPLHWQGCLQDQAVSFSQKALFGSSAAPQGRKPH